MFSTINTFFNKYSCNEAEIKFFDAARCGDVMMISDFFKNLIPVTMAPFYNTKADQAKRNLKAIGIAIDNGHQKTAIAIIENDLITFTAMSPSDFRILFFKGLINDSDELVDYLISKGLVDPSNPLPICEELAGLDPLKWHYGLSPYTHLDKTISKGYQNPLYLACASGSAKTVKMLLSIKPSIVSITDGKFGYYDTDTDTPYNEDYYGQRTDYDELAVEAAQKDSYIAYLVSQHFGQAQVNDAIRVAQTSFGCTIC